MPFTIPVNETMEPVDSPYDALNRVSSEDAAKAEFRAALANSIGTVFHWLVDPPDGKKRRLDANTVGRRVIAAPWLLKPDLLDSPSLSELSDQLGVSDSIMSRYAAQFRDRTGIKNRMQRSDATRSLMRRSHTADSSKN